MKPPCTSRTAVSFSSNTRAATSAGRGRPRMTPLPPQSAWRCGSSVSTQNTCSFSSKTAATPSSLPVSCRERQLLKKYFTAKSTCCSFEASYAVAMHMPEKLQPGPLAGQISFFAPVSLFFFFFLIFIITTMRNIDLHPMNYFFLAAAFFAFHLLLAYLVDHVSIHLSFIICSLVSIFLVISYLRLVVNMRFALLEAGGAQFVYLVLFSYAFFFEGFTGLAVTIGAIVTLFVVMQLTARLSWAEKFSGRRVGATSADGR